MKINEIIRRVVRNTTRIQVLEEIIENIEADHGFYHVVSINPEILMTATRDPEFLNIVLAAHTTIVDGIGVKIVGLLAGIQVGERYSGVDLMSDMLKVAHTRRLRVLLIGGRSKIAEEVVVRQKESGSRATFVATEGFAQIASPTADEIQEIESIVTDLRPHMVFVAYGSPYQEKWIWANQARLKCVCMGVGGSFDFLAGSVRRAPIWMRSLGLEWLFRLIIQPWRIGRQTQLVAFVIKSIFNR